MGRYIKADIDRGLKVKWYIFAAIILLSAVRILLFDISINNRLSNLSMNNQLSVVDNFFYMFRGMKEYIFTGRDAFEISDAYLIMNIILAILIGIYPVKDSKGVGRLYMVKGKNRSLWWLSKCVWNVLTVVFFYISIYVGILAGTIIYELISHSDVWHYTLNIDMVRLICNYSVEGTDTHILLLYIIFMPVAASIVLSYIQMLISFLAGQITGYIIVIIAACMSAYYMSPFAIGNGMMALRYVLLNPDGVKMSHVILISIVISFFVIFVGNIYFKKKDII